MKVVINGCFGGFSLSAEGQTAYLARQGRQAFFYEHARTEDGRPDFDNYVMSADPDEAFFTTTVTRDLGPTATKDEVYPEDDHDRFYDRDLARDDPDLVSVVEELGERSWGRCAALKVVEVPDDVVWEIAEYDGCEHVAEKHRVWS